MKGEASEDKGEMARL
jgi:T-complex protein 1 subunit beta